MKLQTTFMLLLTIALIFTAVGYVIEDFSGYYPEAGNVSTSWSSDFSYADYINTSFLGIADDIQAMTSEESGWQKILSGLIVFAKSVITGIIAVLATPGWIISIIAKVAVDLEVPASIATIVGLMVTGSVIFMLIKFVHRSPV